jgi:sugar/nucleoside kinase (ribokinase family)
MAAKFDAVVAGHICLDIIPQFTVSGIPEMGKLFVPGKLINMGPVAVSTGGPVSNTGLGLQILGINAKFMGKVGKDFFGQGIISLLAKYNAADSMTVVDGEHTSYTVALVPGDVDRIFLHHPGANNTFSAQDVNYDLVAQARHFHLGYPPLMRAMYRNDGRELIEIFRRAKAAGATTSLDMSLPDPASESGQVNWRKILENLLPYVDLPLPSGEEVLFMLQRKKFDALRDQSHGSGMLDLLTPEDLHDVAGEVLKLGGKVAVIKLGHRGIYLRSGPAETFAGFGGAKVSDVKNWARRELWEEAFYVEKVASATGSGDSAIAGFLSAFLRGKHVEDCLKLACCMGGQNVQVMDAVSGLQRWEESWAMIPGWRKRRQELTSPGWKYDEKNRVWIGAADGR